MGLIDGIKLYWKDSSTEKNIGVLELSTGTIPAKESMQSSTYADDSFVPRFPWRVPTIEEAIKLNADSRVVRPLGTWIAILRVPNEVIQAFASLREFISSGVNERELLRFITSKHGQTAIDQAISYAVTQIDSSQSLIEAPTVHFSQPDALTTTKDPNSRFIGLHIDSWYRLGLEERLQAPNRLSINIGNEARYLLYINLPLQKVYRLLREHFPKDERRSEISIGLRTAFMLNFPDYPVVKVRIEPGQAYLAPTENFIHDGCTLGQTSADVQFNVRGRFVFHDEK